MNKHRPMSSLIRCSFNRYGTYGISNFLEEHRKTQEIKKAELHIEATWNMIKNNMKRYKK